jgi:phosphate-selective porin OprO/OprP
MFIERGFPTFLVPNRDIGGMLQGELGEGLFAYQIGGFDDASDQQNLVNDSDDGKSVDARVFFHPFRLIDNELLDGLGIGLAGTWGDSDGGSMPSYRMQADSTNFFTYLGASGGLPAVLSDGTNYRHASPTNQAWQVEASWALTGEDAAYKGLIPATSFSPGKSTWGAFEVAARFGEIDFDDDLFPTYANPDVSASKAYGYTLGVNWYLNRWLKFMVNWEQTWFDGGAAGGADRDAEDTIYTRLQLQY